MVYNKCIILYEIKNIIALGSNTIMSRSLEEISENHFDISYCTFWEEHIFVSDHKDSPKVFINSKTCVIR